MTAPLIDYGRKGLKLEGIPVCDIHAHIGHFSLVGSPPLESQVREMDRIGIEVALVSSVEALHGDIAWGNDQVAEAARRYPGRFLGYCHVSAQYPDQMLPELERCFRNPVFRGIKVYQVGTDFDHAHFDPVWAFARERRLPVLAHTWAGNLTGLDRAALRFPEVFFLMGHAGSGFAYQPYLDAARRAPNLVLDLTYSREHTNMIEHFVAEVGADRIVWGSDAPTFSMSQQVGKILFARIPDEAKRKILYGNAATLLRLGAD
jgi:hypothetical protein